jgi:hypothetical protein
MDRVPITSASIVSAGYSPEGSTLELEYSSGAVYQYFAVPKSVFESLLAAASKGAFVVEHIKGRYPYRLVGR